MPTVVLNNKTGPLFLKFNRCKNTFLLFKKMENIVTQVILNNILKKGQITSDSQKIKETNKTILAIK